MVSQAVASEVGKLRQETGADNGKLKFVCIEGTDCSSSAREAEIAEEGQRGAAGTQGRCPVRAAVKGAKVLSSEE